MPKTGFKVPRTMPKHARLAYQGVQPAPTDCLDVAIQHMLASLRHLCDAHNFDFAKLDRNAYQIYLSEREQQSRAA